MLRNLIVSAAGAGVAVCLVVAGLQLVTTEPLILHAETFETVEPATPAAEIAGVDQHDAATEHHHDEAAWQPADGLERTLYTVLADLLVGMAVSLMLLGAMIARGDPIDAKRGLLWGAAGFVAASLLPSLGLPPELPGTPVADLLSRQIWWLGTAFASAAGLYLLAFGRAGYGVSPGLLCWSCRTSSARRRRRRMRLPIQLDLQENSSPPRLWSAPCFGRFRDWPPDGSTAVWREAVRRIAMATRVLVVGGQRSGKSRYAERLVAASGLAQLYLAVATAGDGEMADRIATHRARRGAGWRTVEEPLDVPGVLRREAIPQNGSAGRVPDPVALEPDGSRAGRGG